MSRLFSLNGMSLWNPIHTGIKIFNGKYPKIALGTTEQTWIPVGPNDANNLIKGNKIHTASIIRRGSNKTDNKYLVVSERPDREESVIVKWRVKSRYRQTLKPPRFRNSYCYGFKVFTRQTIYSSFMDILVSIRKGGSVIVDRPTENGIESVILTWNEGNSFSINIMENNNIVSNRPIDVLEA